MSWVPWVATREDVVRKMLKVVQVGQEDIVYDLGCGDSRILITAIEAFRARKAVGYELRKDLCQSSLLEIQKRNLQNKINIFNKNFYKANLSEALVVILYLSNMLNEFVRPKLGRELQHGTRVASLTFKINNWKTSSPTPYIYRFSHPFAMHPLYGWHYPFYPIYLYVIPDAFPQSQ